MRAQACTCCDAASVMLVLAMVVVACTGTAAPARAARAHAHGKHAPCTHIHDTFKTHSRHISQVRSANSVPRSINGVSPSKSQLQIPKTLSLVECKLLCAELEANVFAEGVSAVRSSGGRETRLPTNCDLG